MALNCPFQSIEMGFFNLGLPRMTTYMYSSHDVDFIWNLLLFIRIERMRKHQNILRCVRFPTAGHFNLKSLYVCSESTKQNKNREWCNLAQ